MATLVLLALCRTALSATVLVLEAGFRLTRFVIRTLVAAAAERPTARIALRSRGFA